MQKPAKTIVQSFPAYDIIEARDFHMGTVSIRAGQEFAVYPNDGTGRYLLVTAGSAAAYALQYNECPVESYNRAVENGHETHWLNAQATSLTSHRQERKEYTALYLGQVVYFEGRLFEIHKAGNGNYKLVERK